ncbi:MAG: SIS domain-containing protein, partial [Planctomycetota bacterium]
MPTEAHKPGSEETHADPNQLDERAFVARVFRHESDAVARLAETLDGRYTKAVDLICACADAGGTVLVSGLGKSGWIGSKISATMASLGLPSHAVHPTEAAHGDLGRFRTSDLAVCLSHSGETEEVVALASILRQDG